MSQEASQQTEVTEVATKGKKGVKPADMRTTQREQRGKDIFIVPLSRVTVEEDFNKRTDESYGDIEELANSIEAGGQITPAYGHRNPDGTWVLTAGHRRYAALLLLSKRSKTEQTIKIMKTDDKTIVTRLTVQYLENVKHATNDYDKALIIGGLMKEGLKQKDIVKRLGIPQPMVSRLQALLETPEDVQEAMRNKEISPVTVGKMLKTLKDDHQALSSEVKATTAKAKAEGKTKATDRHSAAAGTRTPQTIMKELVKKYAAKEEAEEELTDAEAFAFALCQKLLSKPSDRALNEFIRNYGK